MKEGRTNLTSLAFSPDGKRFITAGQSAVVTVWEAAGSDRLSLTPADDRVRQVAFSGDGKCVAAAGKAIRLWDASTGKEIRTVTRDEEEAFSCIAFSGDGKWFAAGCDTVEVWDANKLQREGDKGRTLPNAGDRIAAIAFRPGEKPWLAVAGNGVKVWDAATGKEVPALQVKGPCTAVTFSADGKHMAAAGRDKTIRVHDADTGQLTATIAVPRDGITSLAFSPDGKQLVSAGNDVVRLWDLESRQELVCLYGYQSVAFRDGKHLAALAGDSVLVVDLPKDLRPRPPTVIKADLEAPVLVRTEPLRTLKGHKDHVLSLAYRADGKRLATASMDKTLKLFDPDSGEDLVTFRGHKHWVRSLSLSADGKRLASSCQDGLVAVWDTATGQETASWKADERASLSVALSPDGKYLVSSGEDSFVKVWDAAGKKIHGRREHSDLVLGVAYRPDGKQVASCSMDGRIMIFDTTTWKVIQTLGEESHVTPSGRSGHPVGHVVYDPTSAPRIAATHDKAVKIWDTQTGRVLLTFNHKEEIFSIAFSPDGKRIASLAAPQDALLPSMVIVWDTASGQELIHFKGTRGHAGTMAFSPDGKNLAVPGEKGEVQIWDVTIPVSK